MRQNHVPGACMLSGFKLLSASISVNGSTHLSQHSQTSVSASYVVVMSHEVVFLE